MHSAHVICAYRSRALTDRRPDLRHFSHLEALIETRSVSRAAERMGVSQPAMSRILARLRDQLDDPILVRGSGGMMLTARAEAMADPLRNWLAGGELLLQSPDFEASTLERAFRIASTDFGILSTIRPALAAIAHAAPGISLQIEPLTSRSLAQLSQGKLDMVVIGYPPTGRGVQVRRLYSERRLGLCRRDHPVLEGELTLDRYLDFPHIAALVGDGFPDPLLVEGDMARRRVLLSAPSFSTVPSLVAATDALSILPSRAARHFAEVYGLAVFEPPTPLPDFDYYLAWHARSDTDPAILWLRDSLSRPQEISAL